MIQDLLKRNVRWSSDKRSENPHYFEKLAALQSPEYLWIGCSDSRVPANVITGLEPGEVFVHRNIANLIHPSDLNMLSVVEFAVRHLRVRHVVVCGHYGCGGVRAAVSGASNGVIDHWLQPIRDLARSRFHCEELPAALNDDELDRLSEASTREQVARLARTPIIQQAWREGQDVKIHGWIYGLTDGLLHDLDCARTRDHFPA